MPYIIELVDADTGDSNYIAQGEWSDFSLRPIGGAKEFATMEEVDAALQSADFTKRNEFGGTEREAPMSCPPSIPWAGLGICYAKRTGRGRYVVYEVSRTPVKTIEVREEIR